MRLRVRNFANISDATIDLLDDSRSVVVCSKSASGKTTLAKLLYAFLSGDVKTDIVSVGSQDAEAELEYGGKRFRLRVSGGSTRVDTVMVADYAPYLVLTENTPMHAYFVHPDKFSIDVVIGKVVKRPSTKEIDEKLATLEKEVGATSTDVLGEYQRSLAELEAELEAVNRRLGEVNAMIGMARSSGDRVLVDLVVRKRDLEKRIREVGGQASEIEKEVERITAELQGIRYEDYRAKRKSIAERVERVERTIARLRDAAGLVEQLKRAAAGLAEHVDVLHDVGATIFGISVTQDLLESLTAECETLLGNINAKIADAGSELTKLRSELEEAERAIREYNEKFNTREELLNKLKRLHSEKKNLEVALAKVEREIAATGKTEEEILRDYATGVGEDLAKLLAERAELESKRQAISATIQSLRSMIDSLLKSAGGAEEKRRMYEELRATKEALETKYQKTVRAFTEAFRARLSELLGKACECVTIRHLDAKSLKFGRPGTTFSKSERMIVSAAYVLALAEALSDINLPVPFVVLDVLSPMDTSFEKALLSMVRHARTKVVVLKTGDEHSVAYVS